MKLSIIIPVYNEVSTIKKVIDSVNDTNFDKEIIVVDDGSTDGTREALEKFNNRFKIIYHKKNMGKGAAIRSALEHITGDVVLFQDADLEYDPSEYIFLIEPIQKGFADVVYGSRLSGGRPQRMYMFWHKLGNAFLTFLTNILYNTTLSDMETGYKVFKRDIIRNLNIKSKGFSVEAEITAKVLKKGCRVYEVPISYYGRSYAEGKKITWKQGVSAVITLLWYRFFN